MHGTEVAALKEEENANETRKRIFPKFQVRSSESFLNGNVWSCNWNEVSFSFYEGIFVQDWK